MKFFLKTLGILVLLMIISACGAINDRMESNEKVKHSVIEPSKPQEASIGDYETKMEDEKSDIETKELLDSNQIDNLDNYIEKNINIEFETTDYDKAITILSEYIKKYEGIVEYENTSANTNDKNNLRFSNFIVKIPRKNSDEFSNALGDLGNLLYKQVNSENLKSFFVDINRLIDIKERQLEKFNELLEKSDNINDTLIINERIIAVEAEIDELKNNKRNLTQRVTYDTFNINISQVYSYDKYKKDNPNFLYRIKEAIGQSVSLFVRFFEEIIVGIFLLWPLILLSIIIIVFIVHIKNKNKNKTNN